MKKVFLAGLLIVFTVIAAAQATVNLDELQQEELDAMRQLANSNAEELPGFVNSLVGDQNINVHLNGTNASYDYTIETDGARITTLEKGSLESPTLEIWSNVATLRELMESDSPREVLGEKLGTGEISYSTRGFWNSLRFSIASLLF